VSPLATTTKRQLEWEAVSEPFGLSLFFGEQIPNEAHRAKGIASFQGFFVEMFGKSLSPRCQKIDILALMPKNLSQRPQP
jgi:hypothetical protein